jgi:hypothetical protein
MTFSASLKSIRLMHRYLGLFFAPTILFSRSRVVCRCSGCTRPLVAVPTSLPTSSCIFHNCIRRGRFTFLPERLLRPIRLSQMAQSWLVRKLETPKPTQAPPPPNSLPMKVFFAATALALAASTSTGLIMGWKYARRKSIVLLTLATGVVIPVILLV